MNLRDLEYFCVLAEELHFGKAAYRLFITQPTLSAQIKKLEDELGGALFERSTRSLALSSLGSEILGLAQQIIQSQKSIEDIAKSQQDPLSGTLHLGSFPTLGPWLFPKVFASIEASLGGMQLYFHEEKTQNLIENLKNRSLDAALLAWPDGEEFFKCEDIGFEPFFLLSHHSHPLAGKVALELNEIRGHELMLLSEGHCLRDQVLDLCHQFGADSQKTYLATGLETMRQTIRQGRGITLFPRLAIPENPEPELKYTPFMEPMPGRRIVLAYRPSHPKLKALKILAECLRAWFVEQGMGVK